MNFDNFRSIPLKYFETTWVSPANIAFVKYWGKKGHQLPANPSVSMTLKNCFTKTQVKFIPSEKLEVELKLSGMLEPKFAEKIEKYLISLEFDWIHKLKFEIQTENSFPHGTGIASSASGLSAFVLCLTEYMYHALDLAQEQDFYKRASFLSRLASGSACRSVFGGFVSWGEESDEFGSQFNVHEKFLQLKDTVLVISGKEKEISSRQGHSRMNEHPFAAARFAQAKLNYQEMKAALISGDEETMGRLLESEALSLHAMMMTSPDSYTLLRPNSLLAMEKVREFRVHTGLPVYFTLDAGPNLHLIHPESSVIKNWIEKDLKPLCEKVLFDEIGGGPWRC
jgi:diphosphomevalonate decarboxylase